MPGDVLQWLASSPACEHGLETIYGLRVIRLPTAGQLTTKQHRLVDIVELHAVRACHQQLGVNLGRIYPSCAQRFGSGAQL